MVRVYGPACINESDLKGFLPGPIGKWAGKVYSVGLWDAGVAMFARKSILDKNGIRIPTLDKPWTCEELTGALDKLKASGFEFPLDIGTAWTGEWYPYAFCPFLWSLGGDIVDRSTYKTAEGALNGEAAVKWGKWWQGLFQKGYAQPTQDLADRERVSGRQIRALLERQLAGL